VKGQIASQLFMYILGIIVVGLLLLVGFKAVQTLEHNQCKVRETQFVTQLASAMEKNKGWGLSRIQDFELPCDTDAVCFVSREAADLAGTAAVAQMLANQANDYPLIVASIQNGEKTNVFLKKSDGYIQVPRFAVPAPIIKQGSQHINCITGSPLQIQFEGLGDGVQVHAP
jgi:hypothetical protein